MVNAEQLLLRCRYRLALQVHYLMRVGQRALTWHKRVKLLPTLLTNLNVVLRIIVLVRALTVRVSHGVRELLLRGRRKLESAS